MIPQTKKAAVEQALQVTFGVNEFESITELTTGLSTALVFRMIVLGKPYLLRIITRTDAMNDPTLQFICMKAAADAGLAPRIWYTSIEDRMSITDFVEAKPFPIDVAKLKMPETLKRLHGLPPFPFRINYLDKMDGFVRKFQDAKILPESMTSELFKHYEHIKTVYPRNDSDMVGCHNDLKPENVLFDGEQVWLVDWEAAFLNDRYLDLAVVANFLVMSDNDEKEFLKRYFGGEATEYQRARFFLMSQLLHIFYCTVFMVIVSSAKETIDLDLFNRFDFRVFNDRMWAGEINLANNDARQQYAWVHLQQVLHNLQLKRFDESLNIVAQHRLLMTT